MPARCSCKRWGLAPSARCSELLSRSGLSVSSALLRFKGPRSGRGRNRRLSTIAVLAVLGAHAAIGAECEK